MQIFKIKRTDGLFSSGGRFPMFRKLGKVWSQRNHLTNHIRQVKNIDRVYKDCAIIIYEVTETELGSYTSINDYVAEIQEKDFKRRELADKRWEECQKQLRLEQFEELKKEFE